MYVMVRFDVNTCLAFPNLTALLPAPPDPAFTKTLNIINRFRDSMHESFQLDAVQKYSLLFRRCPTVLFKNNVRVRLKSSEETSFISYRNYR